MTKYFSENQHTFGPVSSLEKRNEDGILPFLRKFSLAFQLV